MSQRPRRCLGREIGNPLTMFHGKSNGRAVKWSMFRVILFGLFIGFLLHFPTHWGPWEWAALTTLALAITVDTLFAMAPLSEGLAALAAIFGAAVSKRMSTSVVTTETREEVTPAVAAAAADPAPRDEGFTPHAWAEGEPDEGLA